MWFSWIVPLIIFMVIEQYDIPANAPHLFKPKMVLFHIIIFFIARSVKQCIFGVGVLDRMFTLPWKPEHSQDSDYMAEKHS